MSTNSTKIYKLKSAVSLSQNHLMVFFVLFSVIGGYSIFNSYAAGSIVTFGSFESGNLSEYADSSQNGNSISIVTSPVREGKYAGKFTANNQTTPYLFGDQSNMRIHMLGFPSSNSVNLNNGSTFWHAVSLRIPSTSASDYFYAGPEIHQSGGGGCTGPAPLNVGMTGNQWRLIIRGNNNCANNPTGFIQNIFGSTTGLPWANGISSVVQRDQWYDFMMGWHMASDNTGWFEAWVNGPGTNGRSVQVVPRTNIPTSFNLNTNYPMSSLYYPSSIGGTNTIYYDGGAFSTDFNALVAWQNNFTNSWSGTPSPPPPNPLPTVSLSSNPSFITNSQSSTLTWSTTNATSCIASNAWTGTKATSGTQTVTPTATSTYTLSCTGTAGTATQSTTVTVNPPPPPTQPVITQNITAGQTLSGTITWNAVTTATNIAKASFDMDNNSSLSTIDTTAPYSRTLNTTILSNGTHSLGLTVTLTDGTIIWQPYQIGNVTINNSTSSKPADLNSDNQVDITDLSILLSNYNTTNTVADINKDGTVNLTDLSILLSNYGS